MAAMLERRETTSMMGNPQRNEKQHMHNMPACSHHILKKPFFFAFLFLYLFSCLGKVDGLSN
jgi:hypothetical protein